MFVKCAGVAQLVERLFCKQMVGGSIPLAGLIRRNLDKGELLRKFSIR